MKRVGSLLGATSCIHIYLRAKKYRVCVSTFTPTVHPHPPTRSTPPPPTPKSALCVAAFCFPSTTSLGALLKMTCPPPWTREGGGGIPLWFGYDDDTSRCLMLGPQRASEASELVASGGRDAWGQGDEDLRSFAPREGSEQAREARSRGTQRVRGTEGECPTLRKSPVP